MFPGLLQAFRSIYWGFHRTPNETSHRLYVFARFGWPLLQLWLLRLRYPGRPMVVISLLGQMGDIVAAEPISRFARQRYSNPLVVWVTTPVFDKLLERFPMVDKVVNVTCLTEWLLMLAVGVPGTVWDLHHSDAACGRCRAPLWKGGPAAKVTMHNYFDFGPILAGQCLNACLPILTDGPEFDPGADAARAVDALDLPDRFVVIHCTASSHSSRNWTVEAWDKTSAFIHDTLGWPIVEIGMTPATQGARDGRYRNLCGRLSMVETAEVIRRATLLVDVDSGPAHFANAVGTPGIVLMGKWLKWSSYTPYSGRFADGVSADLLRVPGPLPEMPVEMVTAAVERRIGHFHPASSSVVANA